MVYFFLALKGVAVGAANVMPGISGATLAVIFRVYDRLIGAINALTGARGTGDASFSHWKDALRFLVPFGLGMAAGIIGIGSIISILIGRFSFQSAGFIAGLMAGSVPFLHKTALARRTGAPVHYVAAGLAAVFIAGVSVFIPTPELSMAGTPGIGVMALLFFGGMLAAAAMVVPGVSGAIVLMLLGIYPLAMDTINLIREYLATPLYFSLLPPILRVVIPIGLGIIPGILLAGKGIAFLLERYFTLTYFIIIGLVLGTVFALFSDPRTYQSGNVTLLTAAAAAVAFVIGSLLALLLGKDAKGPMANRPQPR